MSAPRRGGARPGPAGRSSARTAGPRPSRQVRGLTFLGLLAATLVTVALAAFGILLWIAPGIAAVVMLGGFVWLRAGVQAEIRARRAARRPVRRARPAGVRRAGGAVAHGSGHGHGTDQQGEGHDVAELGHEEELRSSTTVLAGSRDGAAQAAAEEAPDGWRPVPVPPPTYTLKAKAERPASAADLAQPDGLQPAGVQQGIAYEGAGYEGTGYEGTVYDAMEYSGPQQGLEHVAPGHGGESPEQSHPRAAYGT